MKSDDSTPTPAPPAEAPPAVPMPKDQPPAPPAEQAPAVDAAAPAPAPGPVPEPTPILPPMDTGQYITVPETCQLTDNMGMKYTAYRVEVRPPPPVQQNGDDASACAQQLPVPPPTAPTAVLRRYRDFAWIHTALSKERPGTVVPPVPEKNAVARFDMDFVEDRRSHLEQFLRRAYVHPELRDTYCLDAFLRADDAAFSIAKNAKPGAVPAASLSNNDVVCRVSGVAPVAPAPEGPAVAANGAVMHGAVAPQPSISPTSTVGTATPSVSPVRGIKGRIKKLFSETKTQLAGKELVHSPDDHLFDEIQAYADALEKQMKSASARATSLVKKNKDSGADYAELGAVLATLGQAEGDGSGAGTVLRTVGETVSANLAPVATQWAHAELTKLDEPLHDHVKYVAALRYAIEQRSNRRLTYTTALNKLGEKRAALTKFHGAYGADMKRYDAEMSLQRAEAAAEKARIEFEDCSQRLLREMDRFRAQRAEEMRKTMVEYVKVQAEYTAKMSQVWSALVPQLEAIPPAAPGAAAAPAYSTNENAGRVPPIPSAPAAPLQHCTMLNQTPAPLVGQHPPAPGVGVMDQNGNNGEIIGGMMYRSTCEADVVQGL